MHLLNIKHQFLFRRIQAACNALFLDIADFLSRKTIIKKEVSRKDHVLQEFHALVTRNSEKSISLVSMRISWPSVSSTLHVSFVPEREKV